MPREGDATGCLHREVDLSLAVRFIGAIGQVSLGKRWDVNAT